MPRDLLLNFGFERVLQLASGGERRVSGQRDAVGQFVTLNRIADARLQLVEYHDASYLGPATAGSKDVLVSRPRLHANHSSHARYRFDVRQFLVGAHLVRRELQDGRLARGQRAR